MSKERELHLTMCRATGRGSWATGDGLGLPATASNPGGAFQRHEGLPGFEVAYTKVILARQMSERNPEGSCCRTRISMQSWNPEGGLRAYGSVQVPVPPSRTK